MIDLAGKTVVITGASAGIGAVTAAALGERGARVILATRSHEKTRPILARIPRSEWVSLDLADLASVRAAADDVANRASKLDVIIANAGVAGGRGETRQGFEIAFGTNHLGHFVFIQRLLALSPERVVVVASGAHYAAKSIDWAALRERTRSRTGWREYQVSKLCNVLYVRELAKRVKAHAYAVHPGVIASELWRSVPWPIRPLIKLGMRTNEQGAYSTLHCATSPEVARETGLFYWEDGRVREPSRLARDAGVAKELWERSEEWARDYLRA